MLLSMARPGLSASAYALLGLLVFDADEGDGLTGYELKQRADFTLRYYWVSPAMSQVYTALRRLDDAGFVQASADEGTTRYHATAAGRAALQEWLWNGEVGFPVLKHPVALRLLMGELSTPDRLAEMLTRHAGELTERRADLQGVRDMLGDEHRYRYAAMVADWGLAYYDGEARIIGELRERLEGMD